MGRAQYTYNYLLKNNTIKSNTKSINPPYSVYKFLYLAITPSIPSKNLLMIQK